jgi:peptide chain release factor 2
VLQERSDTSKTIQTLDDLAVLVEDAKTLGEMGKEEGEELVIDELRETIAQLNSALTSMEFRRMLSGENDGANAIVSINPGAGGTESQDWAEMLLRMYLRYCEKQGWKTDILERLDGQEAGIKSVTIQVHGAYAFGYLKAESGVHRLVRISPFDSQSRRQTSFAAVHVLPELDDDFEVEINDGDLRIDTYRASGAGGQHVNRTDSAVRITHMPTGIVVQCQNERSQHKNKATAMKVLRARMYDEERRKREEEQATVNAGKAEIGWGSQIRSYVLYPYQMVKDLRTEHESSNPQAVIDGDLQPFIEAFLLMGAEDDSKAF